MSKGDLITAIANRAGLTKKSAADALEAFIDTISGELTNGEQVTITGFGTFKVSHRAARTGVNPQNPSQKIQIKASKVPTFKAGKNLKESVNGK
jgi:DNA-binding protein HU-beta